MKFLFIAFFFLVEMALMITLGIGRCLGGAL